MLRLAFLLAALRGLCFRLMTRPAGFEGHNGRAFAREDGRQCAFKAHEGCAFLGDELVQIVVLAPDVALHVVQNAVPHLFRNAKRR